MKNVASWIRASDQTWFDQVFHRYPEVRLWNARVESLAWPEMQGLLLTGGSDISEPYLRQPVTQPEHIQDPDPARDAWEFSAVTAAMERKLPLFAICRGFQVWNVALGGTLHLDIPGHEDARTVETQPLRYAPGVTPLLSHVNSSHHQALAQLGTGLVVEAWCQTDDVIEQVRLPNYPFGLGVQFHPERAPVYQPLFDDFVAHVRAYPA